ncbi:hypothetical protein [Arthrobacter echini]|uniref:hypothetical protein n=1 Tax=Arthrobacter echini TaxID=1529066 RepID=UPI001651F5DE
MTAPTTAANRLSMSWKVPLNSARRTTTVNRLTRRRRLHSVPSTADPAAAAPHARPVTPMKDSDTRAAVQSPTKTLVAWMKPTARKTPTTCAARAASRNLLLPIRRSKAHPVRSTAMVASRYPTRESAQSRAVPTVHGLDTAESTESRTV